MESSRTSLASRTSSRTHFEVFSLGLEASSPWKLPCPRLEDSTIFEPLKFRWKTPETLQKICEDVFWFSQVEIAWKKIFEDLFRLKKIFEDLFFLENTCVCVLGPWPWPRNFFVTLASRGSVLGLGLEIFLCPRPRALCPWLHLRLWSSYTNKLNGRRFNNFLGVFDCNFSSPWHLLCVSCVQENS